MVRWLDGATPAAEIAQRTLGWTGAPGMDAWLAGQPGARSPRDLGGGLAPHGSQYYMLSDVDGFVYGARALTGW